MLHKNSLKYLLICLTAACLSACTVAQAASQSPASPSPSAGASTLSTAQPAKALSQIGYGLAYGECLGYCDHSLIITAQHMRLVHTAFVEQEKYPEKVMEKPTPPETWKKLQGLASFQTLQGLNERIGCPDCADGGAEWVELKQANASKRVTFEPEAGLPQQAQLLAELRKIYQSFPAAQKD